eukprot:6149834-Karenia_brevis.AAC.1
MANRAPKRYRDEVKERFSSVWHHAKWIGQATALANRYPVVSSDGQVLFIRDSTAQRRQRKKATSGSAASADSGCAHPVGVGRLEERSARIAAIYERVRRRCAGEVA